MLQETRIVLRNVGKIDPVSIEDYRANGGYEGLKKALAMTSDAVIGEIKTSALRGRGGAGFPTWKKLSISAGVEADQKYIICNADEGEPGTNKDRVVLAGDPNSIFEGMAIAGYAIGATKGFIYLRYEYPYIFPILETALENARRAGCLGKNIFGSGFDFDITVVSGGGAYVCGEETALIASIEGKRGEPRFKPPYPGAEGLYGKPTVVNNVETLANLPCIIEKGGEWFSKIGVPNCTGTKIFTVCGNVTTPGVVEYPMGTNLKDIVEAHGGVKDDRGLLGLMLGGQSGNLINPSQMDLKMDIDTCRAANATLGTGTVMLIDDYNEILDIVENIMGFFIEESCGKCTPCREGNIRMHEIIHNINAGNGKLEDLDLLEELAETMKLASLCALGQNSFYPVITSLHNFRDDYLKAIERGQRV
ncbi:MAG: NADH-quinone oxidoreductase subunit NuoF [Oscillospiraceae bacterium]|nr:NADH-quinone oxidoreductase subunit NuoF [Oscillospiraceae bacterium]